jgi:hypothetical protein
VGEKVVKGFSPAHSISLIAAFLAGFFTLVLYQRWTPQISQAEKPAASDIAQHRLASELPSFDVTFSHLPAAREQLRELPVLHALEVDKIRGLAGKPARVRGRIFRVGYSSKSNTYFLNFGPSRSALTAVIFASAADLFERDKLPPKAFDGREVELHGEIKDHPQYGLEIILEDPSQIKILK